MKEETPKELQDPFKEGGFKSINKAISASLHQVTDGIKGIRRVFPTKWSRLNRNLLGGLQPGKMYVIAGRPGVGKSAFSNQLIFDLLDNNKNKIQLVWVNNKNMMVALNEKLEDKKKKFIKKKKLFKAYTFDN